MALYGRDDLLDQLAFALSPAPVVLLTGDPGVGKSSVLDAAQAYDGRRGIVAPVPTRLAYAGGALQRGLLEQLASAAAALVTDVSIAQRVAEALALGARQIAEDKGQELALVIGKELLQVVRGKIHANVGDAFIQYARGLTSSSEHTLYARIQAVDADVLATIIGFFEEVVQVAGRPVVLALDNAERLGEEDVRQLADLVERLPEDAAVRVAYAVSATGQDDLRRLISAGVLQIDVPPLTNAVVSEWLNDVGLDPELAGVVQRVAGGYALFVGDAIDIFRKGGSLRDITASEFFERSTRDALRDLDMEVSAAVQRLAAYVDPPPFTRVAELVDVDEVKWAEMRARLVQSRIFIEQPGAQPWFHELRRRAVWAQLDSAIREPAADVAVAELAERFETTNDPELLVALAMIAPESPQVISQPSQKAALDASIDEVAVAAAVMELSEPGGPPGRDPVLHVIGDSLLVYARDVFGGADATLFAALVRLKERGLLHIISNESASVVFPNFDTNTYRLLIGRAGAELRRIPFPRLATAAFTTTVAPRVGAFETARYGLGKPVVANLAREARVAALRSNSPRAWRTYYVPPHAVVQGHALGQPLFASITFTDVAARDQAVEQLEGVREPLLGSEVLIADVLALPVTRIPAEILLQAADRVLDERVETIMPSIKTPSPIGIREVAIGRAEALRHVRAFSSRIERYALELDEPVQLAYAGDERNIELIEIYGGQDGVRALPAIIPVPWTNPYTRFELRRDLRLTRTERLGVIAAGSSAAPHDKEPIIDALAMLRGRAANFNGSQMRLVVPLEEITLQELLQQAADRRFEIATMMHDALPFTVPTHPPVSTRFIVVVCPDLPLYGLVDGSSAVVSVCSLDPIADSDVHRDTVEVAVMPAVSDPGDAELEAGLLERFGLDISYQVYGTDPDALRQRSSYGNAKHVLARLLGHSRDDIELRYDQQC